MKSIRFERFISKEEERLYFTLPFNVPENIERMDLHYEYPRYTTLEKDGITYRRESNIIDLALNASCGEYVGASGSDRNHIFISAYESSQGYAATPVSPGAWEIIIGAYKVADEGVTVIYTIDFTEKTLRRFRGDTHMHTKGSDGVLSSEELVELCRQQKLDFAFITNHNNYSENYHLPCPSDITILPGTEWTHYNGHAGFLGIQRPYKNPFCVNTEEQARNQIEAARSAGAMIVYNHPFCSPECGWKWGFEIAPYNAIEIWNGALMLDNENTACLEWWHQQLCNGSRIPITGGSDFHRLGPLSLPGVPCTCIYAMSRCPDDILSALRSGHGYVKMYPDAPDVEVHAGDAILGDTVCENVTVDALFTNLQSGDIIRQITNLSTDEYICPPDGRSISIQVYENEARFVRYEVIRKLSKGLPPVRVLVSNPIYFFRSEEICR